MLRGAGIALAALLALLGGPAAAEPMPPAAAEVEVVRGPAGWSATYRLDRDAAAWAFHRSALTADRREPWRPQSWTVATPGVRIERRGRYDLLVGEGGRPVPREVRIRFTPFPHDIIADYDPALVFTDGSVALYSEHFHAFPLDRAADADALPADLGDVAAADTVTAVSFRDAGGRVLLGGERFARVTLGGRGAYVLFGPAEALDDPAVATVIDPGLPAWLRATLRAQTPRLLAFYAERLGPPAGRRPTLLVSWAGPTPGLTSMGGSVLADTVVMRFEGSGLVEENAAIAHSARWFVAHEGAHFWLGETVGYRSSYDAWITEGGADLMAIRAVAAVEPDYDPLPQLQRLLDDCAALARGRPVATAQDRNEHRAYYACGAMFALVAEAAERSAAQGDFFSFARRLLDAHREEGRMGRDEWLAELDRTSGDGALAAGIRAMLEQGVGDPAAALAELFARAGVPHRRDERGRLLLA